MKVLKHVRPSWMEDEIKTKVLLLKMFLVAIIFCSSFVWRNVVLGSHLQMFTDGLTNKLMGGWIDGFKEDLVLVRSADIVYSD